MGTLSLISAYTENRIIGINGKLPFNDKVDMLRFKTLTTNHPIIMGLNTFNSLPYILPDRKHIVVSTTTSILGLNKHLNDPLYRKNVVFCSTLEFAISQYLVNDPFVIGGERIFKEAIPYVDVMYLTEIKAIVNSPRQDKSTFAYFPLFNLAEWDQKHTDYLGNDFEDHPYKHQGEFSSYYTLTRVKESKIS